MDIPISDSLFECLFAGRNLVAMYVNSPCLGMRVQRRVVEIPPVSIEGQDASATGE